MVKEPRLTNQDLLGVTDDVLDAEEREALLKGEAASFTRAVGLGRLLRAGSVTPGLRARVRSLPTSLSLSELTVVHVAFGLTVEELVRTLHERSAHIRVDFDSAWLIVQSRDDLESASWWLRSLARAESLQAEIAERIDALRRAWAHELIALDRALEMQIDRLARDAAVCIDPSAYARVTAVATSELPFWLSIVPEQASPTPALLAARAGLLLEADAPSRLAITLIAHDKLTEGERLLLGEHLGRAETSLRVAHLREFEAAVRRATDLVDRGAPEPPADALTAVVHAPPLNHLARDARRRIAASSGTAKWGDGKLRFGVTETWTKPGELLLSVSAIAYDHAAVPLQARFDVLVDGVLFATYSSPCVGGRLNTSFPFHRFEDVDLSQVTLRLSAWRG